MPFGRRVVSLTVRCRRRGTDKVFLKASFVVVMTDAIAHTHAHKQSLQLCCELHIHFPCVCYCVCRKKQQWVRESVSVCAIWQFSYIFLILTIFLSLCRFWICTSVIFVIFALFSLRTATLFPSVEVKFHLYLILVLIFIVLGLMLCFKVKFRVGLKLRLR